MSLTSLETIHTPSWVKANVKVLTLFNLGSWIGNLPFLIDRLLETKDVPLAAYILLLFLLVLLCTVNLTIYYSGVCTAINRELSNGCESVTHLRQKIGHCDIIHPWHSQKSCILQGQRLYTTNPNSNPNPNPNLSPYPYPKLILILALTLTLTTVVYITLSNRAIHDCQLHFLPPDLH